jgi:hypothetical protein
MVDLPLTYFEHFMESATRNDDFYQISNDYIEVLEALALLSVDTAADSVTTCDCSVATSAFKSAIASTTDAAVTVSAAVDDSETDAMRGAASALATRACMCCLEGDAVDESIAPLRTEVPELVPPSPDASASPPPFKEANSASVDAVAGDADAPRLTLLESRPCT